MSVCKVVFSIDVDEAMPDHVRTTLFSKAGIRLTAGLSNPRNASLVRRRCPRDSEDINVHNKIPSKRDPRFCHYSSYHF